LKPEWWGFPLVQEEKYHGKPLKREKDIIIIIIIIIIMTIICRCCVVQANKHLFYTPQILVV
jgi:hypothetical protein